MDIVKIVVGVIVVVGIIILFSRETASKSHVQENITDDDIRTCARQGKKIQAVKWYRKLHDVGLKEAKEAVERML